MTDGDRLVLQYWGMENLVQYDANATSHLELPSGAKNFLADVGLIKASELLTESLGVSFIPAVDGGITTLGLHFDSGLQGNNISDSLGKWVLLGSCYDKLICVSADDGSIVLLNGDPESGFMDWFANSSLGCYVLFITLAMRSFNKRAGGSTAVEAVRELGRELSSVDPEAMKERTNWWPTMLDDFQMM